MWSTGISVGLRPIETCQVIERVLAIHRGIPRERQRVTTFVEIRRPWIIDRQVFEPCSERYRFPFEIMCQPANGARAGGSNRYQEDGIHLVPGEQT